MKAGGSGRVIGGRSLWGGLLDVLIGKYGWTLDYLLWGISYLNIQMLLSDTIQTFSNPGKGDDVAKDARISGDDIRNLELIRSLVND